MPAACTPIAGVPAGTYFARTRNTRGYVDELFSEHACPTCDPRNGTPIVVSAAPVFGIDFTLAASGTITGMVAETTGVFLANVPVSLFDPGGALSPGRRPAPRDGMPSRWRPGATARAPSQSNAFGGAVRRPGVHERRVRRHDGHADRRDERRCDGGRELFARLVQRDDDHAAASRGRRRRSLVPPGVLGDRRHGPDAVRRHGRHAACRPDARSPTGLLAGTIDTAGRHEVTIGAVDAAGCATSRALTLDVQSCAFTLSPSSATVAAAGGTVEIAIADPCGSQTVSIHFAGVTVQSQTPNQVTLAVAANPSAGSRSFDVTIGRRAFIVNQGGLAMQPPFGSLDGPADGAQVSGSVGVGGWALDDLEVRRVRIYRDPVGGEPAAPVLLGDAVFVPGARPDVRLAYPTFPNNDRAGWGFLILTNMLPNQGNGLFRIYAYAEDAEGLQALLGARTIIANNATSTLPFGAIDTPAQGATISGSAYINFGWALTPQPKVIQTDGSTIAILVDGQSIGSPTYNQFRADIAALFPGYANSAGAVGYRAIDTTALAEGIHTIAWMLQTTKGPRPESAAGISPSPIQPMRRRCSKRVWSRGDGPRVSRRCPLRTQPSWHSVRPVFQPT